MLAVNQTTGNVVDEETVGYEFSKQVWEDIVDCLEVAGSTFRLTGDFLSGDGHAQDTMLRCLDSKSSSRSWLDTCHGRKIENPLQIKRQGGQIKIITQRTLLKFRCCA